MPSLRAAVVDYSRSFSHQLVGVGDQSFVCSPLGAWLLLALIAPTNPAAARALGLDARQAAELARQLVDSDHGDYLAALGAWSNRPLAADWLASLPQHDGGPVPDAAGLNRWADERTRGLITEFPDADRAATMAAVLASAVSAKTLWKRPFDRGEVAWLSGRVPGLKRSLTAAERAGVARTASGEFAFTDVAGEDGGFVLLVVGDEGQHPQAVLEAAYDVADTLDGATGAETERGATLVGRNELPVGEGHSWRVSLAPQAATYVETVPFELRASLSLGEMPGFREIMGSGVAGLFADGSTLPVDSVLQSAMARFHAKGFEAAAVTAMTMRSMMISRHERRLDVRFARPFAFVARDRERLPWFSGWVAEPGRDSGE